MTLMTNAFGTTGRIALAALLVMLSLGAAPVAQESIPAHPTELAYPALDFDPPDPAALRHELPGGAVAFVVEDHALPLVNVVLQVRTGEYTAPVIGNPTVANLTGSQMRSGGTASMPPAQFDEELDFLAAQMGSSIGSTSGSASLNCLAKDLDRCMELFFEMLREPRFDEARLALAKSQILQGLERRNDATSSIEGREWSRLLRGDDHFTTTPATEASVTAITREDLLAFHEYAFHPANFVFAISGDVDRDAILERIGMELSSWPAGQLPGEVSAPTVAPTPGLYLVDKADVNQGRVSIGHLGSMQDNPDRYALMIMNHILGGGGFTSRIMSRVRSDEGLAYSAGSGFGFGTYYPGDFRAFFQSRSNAVARATAIVLEEIERIRTDPVSGEELRNAKASFIDTFSRNFASPAQVAGLFANLELVGRDPAYLQTYRDSLAAVTAEDVTRVAREYLHPDRLVILAVGNIEEILAGDADNPEFSLAAMAPGGNVQRVPLPDPMTMEYPAQ